MIVFLSICGLYFLLHLPLVGGILFHAVQHALLHVADHHEDAFLYGLSALLVSLVLLAATSLLVGWWWVAGDAFVVIVILRSLLRADQER